MPASSSETGSIPLRYNKSMPNAQENTPLPSELPKLHPRRRPPKKPSPLPPPHPSFDAHPNLFLKTGGASWTKFEHFSLKVQSFSPSPHPSPRWGWASFENGLLPQRFSDDSPVVGIPDFGRGLARLHSPDPSLIRRYRDGNGFTHTDGGYC